jgi:hydroxymethylbilane synthase
MLKIATRESELALWQARHVQDLLQRKLDAPSTLVPITTKGDIDLTTPLNSLDGRGFFTKELENALLDGRADVAVHSLKDLPTIDVPGLRVSAVLSRADRRECLLVRPEALDPDRTPLPLKPGSRLGTSSARRRCQVLLMAPDMELKEIRGNVNTRVRKLREGEYDAILLARAGIERIDLDISGLEMIKLPLDVMLPAPGQAALAIETRSDDAEVESRIELLDDVQVRREIEAERGLLRRFAGGCSLPMGAYAECDDKVKLTAIYAAIAPDGQVRGFHSCRTEATSDAAAQSVFADLLTQKTRWAEEVRALDGVSIVVTRPPDSVEDLTAAVARMGGTLQAVPTLAFEPSGDLKQTKTVLESLSSYDWILFTSRNAVFYFVDQLMARRQRPVDIKIGAVGNATANALEESGWPVHLTNQGGTGAAFADTFLAEVGSGGRVLWPTAEVHRDELPNLLDSAGVTIETLVVYRATVPPAEVRVHPDQVKADWILVTSPQAGKNLVELYGKPDGARWAAIGPTTQMEMQKLLGFPVTVARETSLEALAEVLV